MEQRIRYLHLDGDIRVAYSLVGSGPFLVAPPAWVSNLELAWAMPLERHFWERLAAQRTLVRYDKIGTGLSSRVPTTPSLESEQGLLGRVVSTLGATRFELLGTSMAAAVSIAWAAEHPETVERLVLYGGWASGPAIATREVRDHVVG